MTAKWMVIRLDDDTHMVYERVARWEVVIDEDIAAHVVENLSDAARAELRTNPPGTDVYAD